MSWMSTKQLVFIKNYTRLTRPWEPERKGISYCFNPQCNPVFTFWHKANRNDACTCNTHLILNTTMISPSSRQNTWPCLISFLSLWNPQSVKKQQQQQNTTTRICLVQILLVSTSHLLPSPKCGSMPKSEKKDRYVFRWKSGRKCL